VCGERASPTCRTRSRITSGSTSGWPAGSRPCLDYDGTLTPIVDRPEDAVISESMRDAVRGRGARPREPRPGLRGPQAEDGGRAHRGRRVRGLSRRPALRPRVKNTGIPTAAASSSKNAGLFPRQIRLDTFAEEEGLSYDFVTEGLSLLDFFDVDISGRDFPRGKPDPEIFLTGARELDAPPETCFVVEDAVSGVQAAKAGELAALGLARAEDAEILAAAGADLVVTTLDDVDIDGLSEGRLAKKDLARKDG
jgi:Haloacid dehalogenase-like hydrolase/Trehalose-phosphatase